MFGLVAAIAVSFVISWIGFGSARRFVRERLRYVDAALTPIAAIVAGLGVALVATPVFTILHAVPLIGWLVGGGTGVVLGISVGLGARSGAQDVKRGYVIGPGA